MKPFDHLWRLLGTTVSFLVFGLAGLLLGLIVFPLVFLFVPNRDTRKGWSRRAIGKAFGSFIWMMASLGVIDYRVEGYERVAPGRNRLIIANHPTLIDVVILISLFPEANCVIKGAVVRNPFMRSVVGAADYISNTEPQTLLTASIDYLSAGGTLLLFPEGTRTRQGQPMRFKPGAATAAIRSGAEILPIVIRCEPVFLHKDVPWHYVPPKKPAYLIRILAPLEVSTLVSSDGGERAIRNQLNDALLDVVQRELGVMDAAERC